MILPPLVFPGFYDRDAVIFGKMIDLNENKLKNEIVPLNSKCASHAKRYKIVTSVNVKITGPVI